MRYANAPLLAKAVFEDRRGPEVRPARRRPSLRRLWSLVPVRADGRRDPLPATPPFWRMRPWRLGI